MTTVVLILTSAILLLGLVTYLMHLREQQQRGEASSSKEPVETSQDCCGQHLVCERDSLLAGASTAIEYYDDEELDAWRGIPADAYEAAQIEFFREILYTLRAGEVAGWVRSLQLRGIEVPDPLRDEILLIINEQRSDT